MKSQVLADLPPKIIQDFYCDLSPLQKLLYEDFAASQDGRKLQEKMENEEENASNGQSKHHVLQVSTSDFVVAFVFVVYAFELDKFFFHFPE